MLIDCTALFFCNCGTLLVVFRLKDSAALLTVLRGADRLRHSGANVLRDRLTLLSCAGAEQFTQLELSVGCLVGGGTEHMENNLLRPLTWL